jgi:hypothetical protein
MSHMCTARARCSTPTRNERPVVVGTNEFDETWHPDRARLRRPCVAAAVECSLVGRCRPFASNCGHPYPRVLLALGADPLPLDRLESPPARTACAKDLQAAFRRRRPGPAGADGAGVPGGPPSVRLPTFGRRQGRRVHADRCPVGGRGGQGEATRGRARRARAGSRLASCPPQPRSLLARSPEVEPPTFNSALLLVGPPRCSIARSEAARSRAGRPACQ